MQSVSLHSYLLFSFSMASSSRCTILLVTCWCHLASCFAQERITPLHPVRDSQMIISVGQSFALGFFSPENSTNRYVGVWYNNVPGRTVVWVANREKPVRDSSGALAIAEDGNLVVLDGRNNTLWSTNVPVPLSSRANVSAVLLQSGNLVLRKGDERVLWESFDFPLDTFLPGMKLRFNLSTGSTWRLRSWKEASDPAPGAFSAGIERQGLLAELIVWNGSDRYWRSGTLWNGDMFSGLTQNPYFMSYLTVIANDQEIYVTLALSDDSILVRFVLTYFGQIQELAWQDGSQRWEHVWWTPSNDCDQYNFCGAFGSCIATRSESNCECLKGHVPKNQEEWDKGNWSAGCVRKRVLNCEKGGDGFFMMEQLILPDHAITVGKSSAGECEDHCKSTCSCAAYAFANVTGTNATCLVWVGDLIDMQRNITRGRSLYLRVDSSEMGNGSSKRRNLPLIVLITVSLGVCLVGSFVYCFWRRIYKPGPKEQNNTGGDLVNNSAPNSQAAIAAEVPLFHFHSIVTATDNFNEANKLGEGGFGPVYRGILLGEEVAVKRLSKSSGQGLVELRNEVELIGKLQHKNLVKLLGWCIHGEEKMLVYEYLPNKSLDKLLFDPAQKALRDWKIRFSIIEGIAQGLLYLHRYSRIKIIHRDLKASNILLDGDMNPKISDFGTARIFGGNQTEANTNRVVGTFGYMPPEYALDGNFSEKSDVFSFGVLLIELVSGRKNTGFYPSKHSIYLLGNAWHLWSEGRGVELLDPVCKDSFDAQQVLMCINVGLLCVQEDANDRPTMNSVISMLGSDGTNLPEPKMPAFSDRSTNTVCSSAPVVSSYSINQVTLSMVVPR